jgi:hypothetical protein
MIKIVVEVPEYIIAERLKGCNLAADYDYIAFWYHLNPEIKNAGMILDSTFKIAYNNLRRIYCFYQEQEIPTPKAQQYVMQKILEGDGP